MGDIEDEIACDSDHRFVVTFSFESVERPKDKTTIVFGVSFFRIYFIDAKR